MTALFGTDPSSALARSTVRRWSGLDIELADRDGACVDSSPASRGALCDLLRTVAQGTRCEASVCAAGKASKAAGVAVVATCHAGMTIVAGALPSGETVHVCGLRTDDVATPPVGAELAVTDAEWQAHRQAQPLVSEGELRQLRALIDATGAAISVARSADRADAAAAAKPDKLDKKSVHPFSEIVGRTPALKQMAALLEKVVKTSATVLIQGESGTGKELIARALHYHGPRAKKNFVVQNCSAFNDNLLESALFGHVKGSFTGAVKDQKGLFEMADGGTFFLDEIGDMSPALQVKLLRVLQEGTFTPVGGVKPVKVDVRIIAASHKDLAQMVSQRQFREDLFFRVNVLKITVPPLRERVGDIPELARHFARKSHRGDDSPPVISDDAIALLCAYHWPGNIRELENEIERMRVLGGNARELTGAMVSARVAAASGAAGEPGKTLTEVAAQAETVAIIAELRMAGWDKDKAALRLGVSRALLDAKCRALGIDQT
ncbi:MAG TPA: sigma-54 dependent transcriptional regulator [Kofleriaceae bacterium]|nr:sigma-54 dependent transcriptional regulator [Kofleriaceae bacterium]